MLYKKRRGERHMARRKRRGDGKGRRGFLLIYLLEEETVTHSVPTMDIK